MNLSPLHSICHKLGERVCPLYKQTDRGRFFLVGSGTPIFYAGQAYLLTAAHVINEFSDGMIITAGNKQMIRFPAHSLRTGTVSDHPGKVIDADVGIFRLPAEAVEQMSDRFSFSDEREMSDITPHTILTIYVFLGYRYTRNKPKPKSLQEIHVVPNYIVMRERFPLDLLPNAEQLRPHVHEAFSAPHEIITGITGEPMNMPKLHGMSGGGIWKLEINKSTNRVLPPKLSGIAIEHHRSIGAVVATRLNCAISLIPKVPDFNRPMTHHNRARLQ